MVSSSGATLSINPLEKDTTMKAEEERPGSPVDAASHSGGYSSDSSAEPVDVSKLDPETLQARIKAQVEYYFSQQNLTRDAYMVSQMNAEGYILVATIASFKKVRHLTDDLDLIIRAVQDSTVCELSADGTMLKTTWKRPARTTIILRDVPEETAEEDIKALFDDTTYSVVHARSDVGQTWFVTMATEEDAKSAVLHLLGKALHGQPVKARLKSETLRPVPQAGAPAFQPAGAIGAPVPGAVPGGVSGTAPGTPIMGQFQYQGYPPNMPPYGNMLNYGGMPVQGWGGAPMAGAPFGVDAAPSAGMQRGAGRKDQAKFVGMGKRTGSGDRTQPDRRQGARGQGFGSGSQKGLGRRTDRSSSGVGSGSQSGAGARKGKKNQAPSGVAKKPQARTPVFKPQDFPSLTMGKLSLDEPAATDEAAPEIAQGGSTESHAIAGADDISDHPTLLAAASSSAKAAPAGSSWAAAVAKIPPTTTASPQAGPAAAAQASPEPSQTASPSPSAPVTAAPVPSTQAIVAPEAPHVARGRAASIEAAQDSVQEPLTSTLSEVQATMQAKQTAVERPKRGWEKPDVAPKVVADVRQIVDDVVGESLDSVGAINAEPIEAEQAAEAASSTPSVPTAASKDQTKQPQASPARARKGEATDEELLKSAFGAWGAKKSFVDIIKAPPSSTPSAAQEVAAPAPVSAQAPADSSVPVAPSVQREGSTAFSRSSEGGNGPKVTSLEGNWRKANRPRKPVQQGGASLQQRTQQPADE